MMWPVSQRYLDTLARSHTQLAYFEILHDGDVVAAIKGGTILDPKTGEPLYTVSGSVNVSSTVVRRSGSITFADPTGALTPLRDGDLLAPYVTEVRCWVGVQYWNETEAIFGGQPWFAPAVTGSGSSFTYGTGLYGTGLYGSGTSGGGTAATFIPSPDSPESTVELVPVGTLVVTNPQVQDHQITVQGYDRMWMLDNFIAPYAIARGTPVTDALTNLLALKIPGARLSVELPDTEDTVNGNLLFDTDTAVADALVTIAASAGWRITVDPMGTFVTYLAPSTNDDPDLTLAPGQFSTMYRPQRQVGTSDGPFNAVVCTNEGGNNLPARGYAEDDNPDSLTNVARIGVRPQFLVDQALADAASCNKAARTKLLGILGLSDTFTVVMLPNHALDIDDVLQVTDTSQGINQVKVITDNFNVPFRAADGVMTVQCRSNVVVA